MLCVQSRQGLVLLFYNLGLTFHGLLPIQRRPKAVTSGRGTKTGRETHRIGVGPEGVRVFCT